MNERFAISVRSVSKAYRIWQDPTARLISPAFRTLAHVFPAGSRLRAALSKRAESYYRDFFALRDISFEVRQGESLGIIGRNGSGKSTLLQIIAGTLKPSTGAVQVNGRVSALLELGSGFNPEFTGRENVFLNGAVLGLSRQDVADRFDAIAAFADIGAFIDQPVKTYSSGMQVRLAFAVSINVDADIIIVDEALSVGDVNFQAKCITALRQLQSQGTTFLIVTHGVDVVKSMCQRGVYLKQGELVSFGVAAEVADEYFREMREQLSAEIARSHLRSHLPTQNVAELEQKQQDSRTEDYPVFSDNADFAKRVSAHRSGTGEAEITDVELLDDSGRVVRVVAFDQRVRIRIHLRLKQDLEFNCGYHIRDEFNLTLLSSGSFTETHTVLRGRAGDRVILELSTLLPLRHGRYSILALISLNYIMNKTAQFADWIENAVVFEVLPRTPQILWAPVYLKNQIRVWQLPT
jgi:lipopolysaccharide transport system ATP-binding protein